MKCHNCGKEIVIEIGKKIFRQDTCDDCGAYLRCCLNCELYDPVAWKECKEPQALRVNDKEIANFCEYFKPGEGKVIGSKDRVNDARKKLDELFKKK